MMTIKYFIEYDNFYEKWNHEKRILRIFMVDYNQNFTPWVKVKIIYNNSDKQLFSFLEINSLIKKYYEVPEEDVDELLVRYGI